MIAIIDYGVGNLFSLKSSFAAIGADTIVTSDPDTLRQAEKLVLPGVGAFGDAAALLAEKGLDKLVKEEAGRGKPLLGICLGMQLLFEYSTEYGRHQGLGLIPGGVRDIREVVPASYKVPHIGWNALKLPEEKPASPLFRYIKEGDCVYFVHSFAAMDCGADTIATAEYGADLTAAAAKGNVYGTQFHPEKSGAVGLNILRAFCEM